ncbi:hypothetical protein [Paramaledivibacter caminithermalis]|jgi:hypothetical protein|uniref:Uncharacterized protein n=1 Tax=Paramaledivibacter caminithermalis (strain DSM 15212 / CIP 107654 / DViRD3) TaxID=1121301 RepID=A0A1M6UCJ0_PARC5|nr:hypothetical protein [Paramaledivibacter caminithermalis]SHK66883.1 hypothetical protein SAMN02745912_03921 [Paramaledivibacter caminithermalis DSM 15212]
MKKLFIVLGFVFTMLVSSIVVFASDFTTKDIVKDTKASIPKAGKIVTVGFNIKDKEELFGEMSNEEIYESLQETMKKLMKDENEYSKYIGSKLIVSVSSNTDKGKSFKSNVLSKSNNLYQFKPEGLDEELISETFVYQVGFEWNSQMYYGTYLTVADGIKSRVGSNYMDGIATEHVSGANWTVKDLEPDGADAYNRFSSWYELGVLRYGYGHFSIDSSGDIIFHGVE